MKLCMRHQLTDWPYHYLLTHAHAQRPTMSVRLVPVMYNEEAMICRLMTNRQAETLSVSIAMFQVQLRWSQKECATCISIVSDADAFS
jgi:hypothetical protein